MLVEFLSWLPCSAPKVSLYRKLGARMGNRVKIGSGSFIWSSDFRNVSVGDGVTIRDNTKFFCERLTIEEDAFVERDSFVSGSELSLGFGCYFGQRMFVDCTSPVRIGREVITSFTNIYTHEMNYAWVTEGRVKRKAGPVTIGRRASLAPGIHIGANVNVGERAIIGSGSIVLKDVAPYTLSAGVPCREIRSIKDQFRAEQDVLDEVKGDLEAYIHRKYPKKEIQLLFRDFIPQSALDEQATDHFFLIGNSVADEVFRELKARSSLISAFDLRRQVYHKNESEITHEVKHRMRRFGLVFKPY